MKTIIIVLLVGISLAGCGSGGVSEAMDKASIRVQRSLNESFEAVYSKPVVLKVRMNDCACDDALEFEAGIYGTWRHVMIRGSEAAMTWLRNEGNARGNGVSFDALFLLENERYLSRSGQQFYQLKIVLNGEGG